MKRRTAAWALAIVLVAALATWTRGERGAVSSALSRDSAGWLAARRYLEARDARVRIHDAPLARAADGGADGGIADGGIADGGIADGGGADGGVLVLAFPWQHAVSADDVQAIGRFLRRGGTVLLAYSGELGRPREQQVLTALGLELREVRGSPPLSPGRWWSYQTAAWELAPAAARPDAPAIGLAALRVAPEPPASAAVLYRLDEITPLIFSYPLHRGRVVAMPSGVMSNAWLDEAGNVDFLESLRASLGESWTFDEYHHGLVAAGGPEDSGNRFAWDLFVAHLALIYLLAVATLSRRFGPAWATAPLAQGSTSSFLRSLGRLHHDLKHHPAAARLLIERASAYDRKLSLDEATVRRAHAVDCAARLTELAGDVARAQRRRTLP